MSASRPKDTLNPAQDTPQGLSRALTPDERPEGPHRSPTTTLATLGRSARALAAASLAPATRRAYVRALERLESWLAGRTLDDGALADYLAQIFDAGRSPAVAGQVVAAVRLRAKLAGTASPAGPATSRVLAGFRREGRARGRGQVAGVRWDQADLAAALADRGSLAGLRDAAIVAIASDAMLRVSEIAALAIADLALEEDGSARLAIRHSKTDQEGEGAVAYVGATTVRRVRAWLAAAELEDGPMFRRVRIGDVVGSGRLGVRTVRAIITRRARDAGVEGRVSGHSLRIGAAQSLAAAGASVVEMQTAGRWTSPTMPGRYARGQLAGRGAVARLRYER